MHNICNPSDINQTFIIEPIVFGSGSTSPIISACTAVLTNYIQNCNGNASVFLNNGNFIFSGNSFFNSGLSAVTITGTTFYSGGTDLINVIQSVVTATPFTGNTSATCITDLYFSNLYGCSPITLHDNLIPITDNTIDLGSIPKRFRDINTVSGTSTVWTSTLKINTPMLDLDLDSLGNLRQITANNSVIQDDTLFGGNY